MNFIKKIFNCFDYVFYRTAERDKASSADSTLASCLNVVGLQWFFLSILFIGLGHFIWGRNLINEVLGSEGLKLIFGILLIVLIISNYYRYRGRYDKLYERWKNEPKSKRRLNGFLIVMAYALLILGMIPIASLP